eukprot:GSMAST32.ASY1.ANO1.2485.1 assembled CDS
MFIAALALITGIHAPYGRYASNSSMSSILTFPINGRLGWFFQEFPCVVMSFCCYFWKTKTLTTTNSTLLLMFTIHYVNRAMIYPFQMRSPVKATPLYVVLMAFCFCLINGYLQSRYLTHLHIYDVQHFQSYSFVIGFFMFCSGMCINIFSDSLLRNLRKNSSECIKNYKIPYGGMFEYISAANYFGELIEWTGFAVACGNSIPAVSFAVNTAFNLIPRGVQHVRFHFEFLIYFFFIRNFVPNNFFFTIHHFYQFRFFFVP